MSISADVRAAIVPKRCKYADVFASLEQDDATTIHNGIIAGLTAADVARVLTKNGHPIGATVVKAHNANTCCCSDAA